MGVVCSLTTSYKVHLPFEKLMALSKVEGLRYTASDSFYFVVC